MNPERILPASFFLHARLGRGCWITLGQETEQKGLTLGYGDSRWKEGGAR